MTRNEIRVPPVPSGVEMKDCTVFSARLPLGLHSIFIKTKDGMIYRAKSSGSVDMLSAWRVNDSARRAYAKLAGTKFSSLKALQKANRELEKFEQQLASLKLLKKSAERYGFKLVAKHKEKS